MSVLGRLDQGFFYSDLPIEIRQEGHELVTDVVLDERFAGPPQFAHGGAIATLFDELLGSAVALHRPGAMTARLEVDYRRLWRLGMSARLRASAHPRGERKVDARGTLIGESSEVLAEACGVWVVPREEPA